MTVFIFWFIKMVVDCVNRTVLESFVDEWVEARSYSYWVGYLQISNREFHAKNEN